MSKEIIIDGVDVSRCSDISGHVNDFGEYECLCRCIFGDGTDDYGVIGHEMCKDNPNCYYKQLKRSEAQCEGMFVSHTDLEKKYKAKEQECERLKKELSTYGATGICETCTEKSVLKCDQLEEENRSLKGELMQTNCYLDADKETIDQLKAENEDLQKQLNNTVMQKCPQCGEVYLNPVGCELYEENQQLKTENKTQKETIDGFLTILDKLGKSNIKLRETLTEIKEFLENEMIPNCDTNIILQKIIDLEV